MTITNAIERALYELILTQPIGAETAVRCWHSINADTKWTKEDDRKLPCIDIRCRVPVPSDNARTYTAEISIDIYTHAADDADHAVINALEEAVNDALTSLYSEFYAGCAGTNWMTFEASVFANFTKLNTIAGMQLLGGQEPQILDGVLNLVGFVIQFNYSHTEL